MMRKFQDPNKNHINLGILFIFKRNRSSINSRSSRSFEEHVRRLEAKRKQHIKEKKCKRSESIAIYNNKNIG